MSVPTVLSIKYCNIAYKLTHVLATLMNTGELIIVCHSYADENCNLCLVGLCLNDSVRSK